MWGTNVSHYKSTSIALKSFNILLLLEKLIHYQNIIIHSLALIRLFDKLYMTSAKFPELFINTRELQHL